MKIGIIGYGKMGKGIFHLFSSLDYEVTVLVRDRNKADHYQSQVEKRLTRALKKGLLAQDQFSKKLSTLIFSCRMEDLAACEVVIESIVENFQDKVDLLRNLEPVLSPKAKILTNTSTFSIKELAGHLKYNDRFAGFHFFYPIPLINLIEIIRGENVSKETLDYLSELTSSLGQKPIITYDVPGSGLNDILAYYYCEGLYILEQGLATPSQIDKVAQAFSRVGPCESIDMVGLKFITEALERTVKVRKRGVPIPELLYKLISQGRLGRDSGRGLYLYQGERVEDEPPDFYLNHDQKHSYDQEPGQNDLIILKRLLYSILNGFWYSLSKGISSAEELSMGISEVLGMCKAPSAIIDDLGQDKVAEEFKLLAQRVGKRFG